MGNAQQPSNWIQGLFWARSYPHSYSTYSSMPCSGFWTQLVCLTRSRTPRTGTTKLLQTTSQCKQKTRPTQTFYSNLYRSSKTGTRQSLPTGFTRRDPEPASHLALIMLAELLRDFSRPVSRADSDEVGSDIKIILTLKGDLVTKNLFSHSRPGGLQSPVLGSHSPKSSSNAIRGENLHLPTCCFLKNLE